MNASSGAVVLDIDSSAQKIAHFQAPPGGGVTFNGILRHLSVRMASGKVLSFDAQRLQQLHGGTVPSSGAWLVEDSGIRSVNTRQWFSAYRRFHKLWP